MSTGSLLASPGRTSRGESTQGRFQVYTSSQLDRVPQLARLGADRMEVLRAVASVLPFRVNRYVVDELIDWDAVPDDPIYQLVFPQEGMLEPDDLRLMVGLIRARADRRFLEQTAKLVRARLNPHPGGQLELNRPSEGAAPLRGIQHKYRQTVLFFPADGQTCHSYCTYCFRWAQFVADADLRFAEPDVGVLVRYLTHHPEVSDVLVTGGDPLVLATSRLARHLEPLLNPALEHITTIRLGTKALAYWPHRFVLDRDSEDLLRLFERIVKAGRRLAVMAHFSHPNELSTDISRTALRRILDTGASIYCQAPIVRHVNDSADTWVELWGLESRLGCVPYYMFVERDTGPHRYFELPLAEVCSIFQSAYRRLPGLARTVRGPVMSATPGKVLVEGVATVGGEHAFVLRFLQARQEEWVGHPFFARYDPGAAWLSQLRPTEGDRFFFDGRDAA